MFSIEVLNVLLFVFLLKMHKIKEVKQVLDKFLLTDIRHRKCHGNNIQNEVKLNGGKALDTMFMASKTM